MSGADVPIGSTIFPYIYIYIYVCINIYMNIYIICTQGLGRLHLSLWCIVISVQNSGYKLTTVYFGSDYARNSHTNTQDYILIIHRIINYYTQNNHMNKNRMITRIYKSIFVYLFRSRFIFFFEKNSFFWNVSCVIFRKS